MSEVETKKEIQPVLPVWSCESTDESPTSGELTVGDKFEINCSGTDTELQHPLVIEFPEEQSKYKLVALKTEKESIFGSRLLVTAYKPGNNKLTFYIKGKNDLKVQVIDFSYNIKSVIEQGKQPKEFGPYGPIEIPFGWLFWSVIAIVLITIIGSVFLLIKNYYLRREQIASLSDYKTSLGPYNQLNKEIRLLQKNYVDYKDFDQVSVRIKEIKKIFDLYLIRKFNVPAFDWSSKKVLNKIKKDNPSFFRRKGAKLSLAIFEFKKAQNDYKNLNESSFEVLIDVLRERISEFEVDLKQKRLR